MATTKVTITVDSDEHQLIKSAMDCYAEWTEDFLKDSANAADMRRKARDELPRIKQLKASL